MKFSSVLIFLLYNEPLTGMYWSKILDFVEEKQRNGLVPFGLPLIILDPHVNIKILVEWFSQPYLLKRTAI